MRAGADPSGGAPGLSDVRDGGSVTPRTSSVRSFSCK